jgi:hypothetical protein
MRRSSRERLGSPRKGLSGGGESARRSRAFLHRSQRSPDPSSSPPAETSRVGLIETGPFMVLAFWEAPSAAIAAARRRSGDPEGRIALRFRDGSGESQASGKATFDICVDQSKGNYFLKLGAPFRTLRCELGILAAGGRFATLARSNLAQTPRITESERYEEVFRSVGPVPPPLGPASSPLYPPGGMVAGRSAPPAPAVAGPWIPPGAITPGTVGSRVGGPNSEGRGPGGGLTLIPGKSYPPAPLPGQAPFANGPGLGSSGTGSPGAGGNGTAQADRVAPAPGPENRRPSPGRPGDPFYAPEMVALWAEPRPAGELPPAPKPAGAFDPGRQLVSGGEEPFAVGGGAPPPPAAVREVIAVGTSYGGASSAPHPPEDKVDLEIHADIVIYGRTRPGTQVYVSGTSVPVRGDGTFEARFALPSPLGPPEGTVVPSPLGPPDPPEHECSGRYPTVKPPPPRDGEGRRSG